MSSTEAAYNVEELQGRHFLTLADFSQEELTSLLAFAKDLKQWQKQGKPYRPLVGKTLGMIFAKSSTRTRVSFEVGMFQLGGHALFLGRTTFSSDGERRFQTRHGSFPAT